MSNVYFVREDYWHKYTGIGSNFYENLTTNEVCDLLNELGVKNNGQKWIDEIKSFTGETDDSNVIQFCLSYTLQSLKHDKDEVLNRFKWQDCEKE